MVKKQGLNLGRRLSDTFQVTRSKLSYVKITISWASDIVWPKLLVFDSLEVGEIISCLPLLVEMDDSIGMEVIIALFTVCKQI